MVETVKRVILISILLVCVFAPINTQAQGLPIGVELDCDQQTIDINVHPQQYEPVEVACTVKNTGSFEQKINLDRSIDGNGFQVTLSESSYDLPAGEEETFIATFTASPGMDVMSNDYNISATVESFGRDPIFVPIGQFGQTASSSGVISSLPYSKMSFSLEGDTSVAIEEKIDGDEGFYVIQLSIWNDGNVDDEVVVEITNTQELNGLDVEYGFFRVNPIYVGVDSYRETVPAGVDSSAGFIQFGIKEFPSEDFSFEIELQAYSMTDSNAEPITEVIEVQVVGSESSGGAFGIDTVSNNDLKLVGMAGGGLFGVIVLLVFISRLTKKAGKQKIAAKEAKKARKAQKRANKATRRAMRRSGLSEEEIEQEFEEEDEEDDLDFDDLDDDFDFEDL